MREPPRMANAKRQSRVPPLLVTNNTNPTQVKVLVDSHELIRIASRASMNIMQL
jgi:hypothetical protein